MNNKDWKFTKREEELMELLWSVEEPMTSVEMIACDCERTWKDNYLKVMIRSLQDKDAIRVCGMKQYKTQYARLFEPNITREDYIAKFAVASGIKGSAVANVAVAMAKETDSDEEVIARLEEIIEQLKEKK